MPVILKGSAPHFPHFPHFLRNSYMPRFQGKYFFLTYPRADYDIQQYYEWLTREFPSIVGAVICRELHQDGSHHRHVAFESDIRLDLRNHRSFDYQGFHPNIQTARNWRAVLQYVKKGEDYLGFGKYSGDDIDYDDQDNAYENAQKADSEATYLQWALVKRIPFGYAQRLWYLARANKPNTIDEHTAVSGTIVLPYLRYLLFDEGTRKSLVLKGPTGSGKSTWAIRNAPRPALLVSHMDDLRHYRVGYHRSIIFDDMDFKHFPRTAQIHLNDFDLDRSIHCRYSNAFIPAKTYKIYTCNEYPFLEDPAIKRRVQLIDLDQFDV
nr:MAG: replication associated protein [Virus sp.]